MATIIFPVYGNFEMASHNLKILLMETPASEEIIVIDDCSHEGFFEEYIGSEIKNRITLFRNKLNIGLTKSLNIGIVERKQRDGIFFVNSDVTVDKNWSIEMKKEMDKSDLIGTVTAPSNYGSIVSIPLSNIDIKKELYKINQYIQMLPEMNSIYIPVPVGHCFYVSEKVLNLLEKFNEIYSPGYGEEVDLGIRLKKIGFHNVVASRMYVFHSGSESFGKNNSLKNKNDLLIEKLNPSYKDEVNFENARINNFETLVTRVRASVNKLSLLIDCRSLSGGKTGTYEVIKGITQNIEKTKFGNIAILVSSKDEFNDISNEFLIIEEQNIFTYLEINHKFDIVFSPNQVRDTQTLLNLFDLAHKVVVLILDFIAADNAQYFLNTRYFYEHRDAAFLTLQIADGVLFNSHFVARESFRFYRRPDLDFQKQVVFNGIKKSNALIHKSHIETEFKYLVVLGASFHHKNRLYALKIFEKILQKQPETKLYLVGPNPTFGGSTKLEDDYINKSEMLKRNVIRRPWVEEIELKEIILNSSLVLITSISEGFGLVPGEVSYLQVPCIFPNQSSFKEVYGEPPRKLSLESLDEDALEVFALLDDQIEAQNQIQYLISRSDEFSWRKTSQLVLDYLMEIAIKESYASKNLKLKLKDGIHMGADKKILETLLKYRILKPKTIRWQMAKWIYIKLFRNI